jgi:signal transduction histidine kinase
VAELVEEIGIVAEPLLTQKEQHLTIHLERDLPEVVADSRRLGQLLLNLLLNASKYSPARTEIALHAGLAQAPSAQSAQPMQPAQRTQRARRRRTPWVRFSVLDRGPGVPPELHERIFTLFYRAADATSAHADGLGLGLAIVKGIAEAHGGQVGVENRPDGGAHFWVSLPVTPAPRTGDAPG